MDDNQDFPLLMVLKVSLLALTLLAICLFVFGNGRNAGDTRNVSAQSNAFVYQPRSWMDEVLPRLETMLVKATNTEMRASLTGKVNMLLYQTGLRASSSALAVLPTKPADVCAARPPESTEELPPRPAGILEDEPAPFHSFEFMLSNQWQGTISGQWVHVFAGADGQDASQGLIFLMIEKTDMLLRLPTEVKEGAVRILAEENLRLTLQTEAGTLLYFDIPARQFAADLEEELPPAEIPPLIEPTPGLCGQ